MMTDPRALIAAGLTSDDLLRQVVETLAPMPAGRCYALGEYLLELATGSDPGGIMIACLSDIPGCAERVALATGLPDLRTSPDGVVNVGGSGARGITLVPLEGDIRQHLSGAGFTATALAVDLSDITSPVIEDPHDGIADIQGGALRALPGALRDEPARCLLAAELYASFGLEPEGATIEKMRSTANLLTGIDGPQTFRALARAYSGGRLSAVSRMLREAGVLGALFPELEAVYGIPQNYYHHLGVWDHTMETLDRLQEMMDSPASVFKAYGPRIQDRLGRPLEGGVTRRSFLAFAGLVHDVGKAATMTVEPSGRIRFQGHQAEGARMAAQIAGRLGMGHRGSDHLQAIVRDHMRLGFLIKEGESTAGRLRVVDELGDHCIEVVVLSLADRMATRGEASTKEAMERYGRAAKRVLADHFWQGDYPPLVDGTDVMVHTGIESGPEVGRALFRVRVAQREGSVSNRAQALEFLAPDFKGKMDTRGT
jgi:poly(A) polymerase